MKKPPAGVSLFFLKVKLLHERFSRFLNCTNDIKSRRGSHIRINLKLWITEETFSEKRRFYAIHSSVNAHHHEKVQEYSPLSFFFVVFENNDKKTWITRNEVFHHCEPKKTKKPLSIWIRINYYFAYCHIQLQSSSYLKAFYMVKKSSKKLSFLKQYIYFYFDW